MPGINWWHDRSFLLIAQWLVSSLGNVIGLWGRNAVSLVGYAKLFKAWLFEKLIFSANDNRNKIRWDQNFTRVYRFKVFQYSDSILIFYVKFFDVRVLLGLIILFFAIPFFDVKHDFFWVVRCENTAHITTQMLDSISTSLTTTGLEFKESSIQTWGPNK